MFSRKIIKRLILALLLACVCYSVFFVIYVLVKYTITGRTNTKFKSARDVMGLENEVRVFNTSMDFSSAKQIHKCVFLKVNTLESTPICVYDPEVDLFVSKYIINVGSWEKDLILEVVSILRGDPSLEFLDFGCNIGVYTLAVAKFGRRVTAIDANRKNLEMLTTSLQMGNLTGMVTLIWNALSDKIELVGFKERETNVGALQMISGVMNNSIFTDENSSIAIALDDLMPLLRNRSVIIKMDIEAFELKAMIGGKKFFEEVDVKFLLMEWVHHKDSDDGARIIQFLTCRGFQPFNPIVRSVSLKIEDRKSWPEDVLWIKDLNWVI
ncbi:uncharacterized protein LOC127846553 [Dreissena polymorpha]|uniref:Methyltransferase FkbM domain-containing protein n=1 Tax=Dreissena polymorpha TaxID=45954 RepID=A0A9D4E5A1_DREPO|nr:uncharacterized protein LOC127846553 [Dreissena polymorpha]KAH3772690.1 hypothetical protein DPMN_174033 [Dreissena polymorpha]